MRARPSMLISVFVALGAEMHEQMLQLGSQFNVKPVCLASKQAWYSFIDPLKGWKAKLTLPSPRFDP
ncbi:hypothetical protein TNCV_3308371 [Trichonephila clavipes]|nr:hypothetical protein TNCV_3308371 [Trichonephila clavipes]